MCHVADLVIAATVDVSNIISPTPDASSVPAVAGKPAVVTFQQDETEVLSQLQF